MSKVFKDWVSDEKDFGSSKKTAFNLVLEMSNGDAVLSRGQYDFVRGEVYEISALAGLEEKRARTLLLATYINTCNGTH